jgi:threonine/homoserine/homoserine lactone efflux protein
MSIDFLILSLIVVVAPGTGVLYTLANGLSGGARRSVAAAFGCTLGILPHLAAAAFGLAALLHASALAFQSVKFAGVAYLIYLAWGALRETGELAVDHGVGRRSLRVVVVKGFLINILNPKLSIFFLAFLPQFIRPVGPDGASALSAPSATVQMLWMGVAFMAMTLVVFIGYGLFAAAARAHIISSPRIMTWVRRVFAGAFLSLGLKLALAER